MEKHTLIPGRRSFPASARRLLRERDSRVGVGSADATATATMAPGAAGAAQELHAALLALGHPTGFTDLHLYPGPHRQALFRWLLTG